AAGSAYDGHESTAFEEAHHLSALPVAPEEQVRFIFVEGPETWKWTGNREPLEALLRHSPSGAVLPAPAQSSRNRAPCSHPGPAAAALPVPADVPRAHSCILFA